jgi:hypothetical protein
MILPIIWELVKIPTSRLHPRPINQNLRGRHLSISSKIFVAEIRKHGSEQVALLLEVSHKKSLQLYL